VESPLVQQADGGLQEETRSSSRVKRSSTMWVPRSSQKGALWQQVEALWPLAESLLLPAVAVEAMPAQEEVPALEAPHSRSTQSSLASMSQAVSRQFLVVMGAPLY